MQLNDNICVAINYRNTDDESSTIGIWDGLQSSLTFRMEPDEDEDKTILKEILALSPSFVCINAPLSLPRAFSTGSGDYLFRDCDKELQMPSPISRGKKLAYAICLKDKLKAMGEIPVWETYPEELAKEMDLHKTGYRKDKNYSPVLQQLQDDIDIILDPAVVDSWSKVDTLLMIISGIRNKENKAQIYGEEEEGQIFI